MFVCVLLLLSTVLQMRQDGKVARFSELDPWLVDVGISPGRHY